MATIHDAMQADAPGGQEKRVRHAAELLARFD